MSTTIPGKWILILLMIFGCFNWASAQDEVDHSYKPLKLSLNEKGDKYIRFIIWNQFWLTTQNLSDEDAKLQITPSIRRSRILAYAQISPRFLILSHIGLNSLSPNNLTSLGNNGDSPQFFLHDVWGEFKLHDYIYAGGGLHYWKGMTRLANQSTLNFMTLDQSRPFVAWHSLGVSDQFARHLGIYFKGQIDKFDYRVAINSPLRNTLGNGQNFGNRESSLTYTGVSQPDEDGDPTGNTIVEGYFRYNFFDTESTKLPYQVGTYLGKKKVFGIGAGFFLHPNGMYNDSTGVHSSVQHFAVDAFLDMPVGDQGAVNAYAGLMLFDYGDNYVSRWAGTGTAIYGHVGYFIKPVKLMPYVAYQLGDYDGFAETVSALDIGLNYFVNGHHAKVTLEYHRINGDIREGAIASQSDALSQLRFQVHIFL
ncbi:MAG: porin [Bacteroidota bacterium]